MYSMTNRNNKTMGRVGNYYPADMSIAADMIDHFIRNKGRDHLGRGLVDGHIYPLLQELFNGHSPKGTDALELYRFLDAPDTEATPRNEIETDMIYYLINIKAIARGMVK